MRTPATLVALIFVSSACVSADSTGSAGGPSQPMEASAEGMTAPSPDEMMAMMTKAGTPGPIHADLAKLAGDWDVDYEFWMQPGGEPNRATGNSHYRSILGGRFMIEEFHSTFMGEPFEGMLLLGYDNVRERLQSVWVDSFSTGFGLQIGTVDEQGNKHMSGTVYDPMTPQGRPMRSELLTLDPDHFSMEMYDTRPDGSEWMTMRFRYIRAES